MQNTFSRSSKFVSKSLLLIFLARIFSKVSLISSLALEIAPIGLEVRGIHVVEGELQGLLDGLARLRVENAGFGGGGLLFGLVLWVTCFREVDVHNIEIVFVVVENGRFFILHGRFLSALNLRGRLTYRLVEEIEVAALRCFLGRRARRGLLLGRAAEVHIEQVVILTHNHLGFWPGPNGHRRVRLLTGGFLDLVVVLHLDVVLLRKLGLVGLLLPGYLASGL